MPREMPELKPEKPQDVVNIVFTLASIHTACITPILRSRFGTHAFAGYPMAFVLMLVYTEYAREPLMAYYVPVWMVLVLYRRVTADRNQLSRYQGYPWMFGWMASEYVARLAEVFVCFFAGVLLSMVSPAMANFMFAEMLSLFIVLATESSTLQARKRAMRDAQLQARQMNDLGRGRSGW